MDRRVKSEGLRAPVPVAGPLAAASKANAERYRAGIMARRYWVSSPL